MLRNDRGEILDEKFTFNEKSIEVVSHMAFKKGALELALLTHILRKPLEHQG